MTAIEWLKKELESYGDPQNCKLSWEDLDSLIDQAKEKEREQIEDSFRYAQIDLGMEPNEYLEWKFN